MPHHFVPLAAREPATRAPQHAATANLSNHQNVFTPVASGAAASPTETLSASSVIHSAPPELNFKRDGDRIVQIEIHCTCGECILLDCNYENGSRQENQQSS